VGGKRKSKRRGADAVYEKKLKCECRRREGT